MSDRQQDEIGRLLAEVEPAPDFPRGRVRERIDASIRQGDLHSRAVRQAGIGGWLRPVAAAAAGLLIFVAGAEYGRRMATPAVQPGVEPSAGPSTNRQQVPRNVSFSIQEQGTAYLAEVARLSETAESMTPEQLEEARQVATAILYGAALELVRAAPDDHLADAIVRSLRSRRRGDDDELIWY